MSIGNLKELFDSIKEGGVIPNEWIIDGKHYSRIMNRLVNYKAGDIVRDKNRNPLGIAVTDSTWRDDFIVILHE